MIIVIPARGGSKGIPGKNLKKLGGKPLIWYTVEAAKKILPEDRILVSTDSPEIRKVVEDMGLKVPFLRPEELASDHAGPRGVLLHALEEFEKIHPAPDRIVLLQPTSPFRNEEHVQSALNQYRDDLDMLVSVKETASNPYYVLREENEEGFLVKSKEGNFHTRQECPRVWEINGAIYIINTGSLRRMEISDFRKVKKYEMDEISSHDIDTPLDWLVAEAILDQSIEIHLHQQKG